METRDRNLQVLLIIVITFYRRWSTEDYWLNVVGFGWFFVKSLMVLRPSSFSGSAELK